MRLTRTGLIGVFILGAACVQPPAEPPRDPHEGETILSASIRIAADDPSGLDQPVASGPGRFPLASLRTLFVRLATPPLPPGLHWVSFEIHDPGGTLYQERRLPFSIGAPMGPVPSPDGMARPLEVTPARP